MRTVWFNEGLSSVRDAVLMIGEARGECLRVLASHRDPHAPALHNADWSFVETPIKRCTPEGIAAYADYCLAMCVEHRVDLFVPQRGRATLAARAEEFAAIGTRLAATGSAEALALIDDKARFYVAASQAGIEMPWTREVVDLAGFDSACAELAALGMDACVKPPHGIFGAGFWRIEPALPLFETLMNADDHRIAPGAVREAIATAPGKVRLLVLEFLHGTEWSLDCLCRDGRLIVGIARRKLGRAQRLETDGPIFALARRAIAAFSLSGLINLQFRAARLDDDTDVRLLEINPRMSGGCHYTWFSGVNLPWWHVALELGLGEECDIPKPKADFLVSPVTDGQVVHADRLAKMTAHA